MRRMLAFGMLGLALASCQRPGEGSYDRIRPSSPEGTGHVFMGREIAAVLESEHLHLGVDRPDRDVRELPDRLIGALRLGPADRVADIGAGEGYYSMRLAPIVQHGRVYAVDLQPALLDTLSARAARAGLRNIVTVEGSAASPNLGEASVDLALIVVSYHEFSHPREMLGSLLQSLRTGGRLVMVEYRAEDATIPVHPLHKMSEAQARREVESVGFEWIQNLDVLPQQHVMVFRKPL